MASIVHDFLEFSAQVKLYHWQTKVYARHLASDKLFGEINELIDKFVEIYIGKNGRPQLPTTQRSLKLDNLNDDTMVTYLNKWIRYLQDKLPEMLDKKDTDLINIRDEMMGLINNTLYLFTFS
jgi:hypothetical protein